MKTRSTNRWSRWQRLSPGLVAVIVLLGAPVASIAEDEGTHSQDREATSSSGTEDHASTLGPEDHTSVWDHAEYEHQYVRITDSGLRPAAQKIHPEMALGWINYSSRIARISFDAAVVKKLTCRTQGAGAFQVVDERLLSPKVQSMQFASLCHLARGEYAYEVETFSGIGTGGGPRRTYKGKILVE